jgi:hypothetical protein
MQSEAERERENRAEGERGIGGEEREMGFPKKETLKYPKRQLSKNTLQLPLAITFAYELRFTRTSCLRTRFDELYNFHEGNFLKFWTEQKVNFKPP